MTYVAGIRFDGFNAIIADARESFGDSGRDGVLQTGVAAKSRSSEARLIGWAGTSQS
jgi:hypothetical protein